ncbi:MAG: LPS export ABC transporter permease LptG [Paracoccaceae bacterium]
MILHFYFARRFAIAFFSLALILFALISLVDFVDQTRRFSDLGLSIGQRLELTFFNVPATMNQVMPILMILATVALFISLARSSELVVTRAAGRSAMRSLLSPVFVAFLIGSLTVSIFGPFVAAASKHHAALAETYRSGGASTLSLSADGLWLREGSSHGQTVIRAARSNTDASVLYDVTFIAYAPNSGPVRRIDAASAALSDGSWSLRKARVWPLVAGINPQANVVEHELLEQPSTLTLDRIRETLGTPASISIWDMQEFIVQLELAGFSARRHHVWFQSELSRPFFLAGMVLVAAAFTMRHTRFGGTGISVLAAVLLGFTLFFVRSFAQILGENGQIPILLAAWAAPIAAILLALGLLLHAEDG